MLLFGIAGRAHNGKTTFAEALEVFGSRAGLTPVVYDIGGMVLAYCKNSGLIPAHLTREDLTSDQIATLARVGEEKRAINENYWIEVIAMEHERLCSRETPKGPFFLGIIPNMRFENEQTLVRRLGGVTVKVVALNADGSPHISRDRDPNHASETALLEINADFYVTAKKGQARLIRSMAEVIFNQVSNDDLKKEAKCG